jgi:hypothetical protein
MGNDGEGEGLMTNVRPGDYVAVYAPCGGWYRRAMRGRVERVSTRVGRGERVTVLLDVPTRDGFAVLEVLPTEVVRVARLRAE